MRFSRKTKRTFLTIVLDIFDMLAFLVFVGGIVLFVRFFIANPFTVIGASMYPTFDEKDFIIVDKISPRVSEWERGDIIVFVAPGKSDPYIKRVIGFPGEIVKFKDGDVIICKDQNGQEICERLEEDYLPGNLTTEATCGKTEFKVDDGLFVMGDNRGLSTDSMCCFGVRCYEGANYTVPYNYIIGKVYVRLFPHFQLF